MGIKANERHHRQTSRNNYSALLKRIADELLSHQESDDRLNAAVIELHSLCSSVSGIDEDSNHADGLDGTELPSGKAISPRDAAGCVLDYTRTSKLLKGVHAAILEARKRFPNTTIEILYAGCGPFAPLAIPLTSRFSASEIRFTLLDIHKRSLDAARRIFQDFGLTAFVREYTQCDAAFYKHEAPHDIHIVLVETMQAALEKEPQVAITMNLASQLRSGGIFIPERIAVDGYLCDLTKEFTTLHVEADAAKFLSGTGKVRVYLGRVLELTAWSCHNLFASSSVGPCRVSLSPNVILETPKALDGEFNLMLLTTITVFDSIALSGYDSGLTCPRILFDVGKIHGGMRIGFAYNLGNKPGFKHRFL